MTEAQHNRAIQIKDRLAHIDKLIDFLTELSNNHPAPSGTKAGLQERGFTAYPKEFGIDQADIDCLREALAIESVTLNTEFDRL